MKCYNEILVRARGRTESFDFQYIADEANDDKLLII